MIKILAATITNEVHSSTNRVVANMSLAINYNGSTINADFIVNFHDSYIHYVAVSASDELLFDEIGSRPEASQIFKAAFRNKFNNQ